MGCGTVDLLDLYDLARGNLPPVRRRELEAHLAACTSCSGDFERVRALERALGAIRQETAVAPSTVARIRIEAKLAEVISKSEPAKARRLWRPAAETASRPPVAPRRSRLSIRLIAAAGVLLLAAAGAVACSALLGSGYPEEPVWRLALLLPGGTGAWLLDMLPIRDAEDMAGDLAAIEGPPSTRQFRNVLLAGRLAAISGRKDLQYLLAVAFETDEPAGERGAVGRCARILLRYAAASGDWAGAAATLETIARRAPDAHTRLERLPRPARDELVRLLPADEQPAAEDTAPPALSTTPDAGTD